MTSDAGKQGTDLDGAGSKPFPPMQEDQPTPGDQERPMSEEEELDNALDDTFPASDPVSPSRIDGPNN